MREIKKLPSLANVAAGATATLNCPLGRTYDRIILEYTGVTRAQLQNIEVIVNGKTIQHFTDAVELQLINNYYGRADNAGFVSLYFNRPEFENTTQQRVTGLGTVDIQTLQVRADIDAAATAPVITAHAVLSAPTAFGLCVKVKRFPSNSAVSGQVEIDNIPRGPRILALHLLKADVNDIEVDLNSVKITDTSKALAEAIQKEHGRVPQTASATHVDYVLEGDVSQALVTAGASDFRLRPTLGTSGALTAVVEYLDGFAGI